MQRTVVLRLPHVRGLHLEQADRPVAVLASARHDPLAVHLGALECPQGAEDGRLTVRTPDRSMGPVIQRHPSEVGRERPVHGRLGIGSDHWFRSRARPDVGDAAAVEGEALLQR